MKVLIIKKSNVEDIERELKDALDLFSIEYDIKDLDNIPSIDLKYDFVFALGGDGTIIKASKYALSYDVPIFGINAGTLGFLSCISKDDDIKKAILNITEGKYFIDTRSTLDVEISREGRVIYSDTCVNEVELSGKARSHVGKFHLYVGNTKNLLNDFSSDGLLVSTPTGASGYAFSASAPIVSPHARDILVTPIYPHAFNQRSFIIEDDKDVIISIDNNMVDVLVDGTVVHEGKTSDYIIAKRGKKSIKIVSFDENMFYTKLRDKINTL